MTKSGALPAELYDQDGCAVVAVRIDGPEDTRGRAAALFASQWGLDFTEVRIRRSAFRRDLEYEAEMAADGIKEPYDGWPLRECKDCSESAPYWVLREECYDR